LLSEKETNIQVADVGEQGTEFSLLEQQQT